jgi:hypothetical protein
LLPGNARRFFATAQAAAEDCGRVFSANISNALKQLSINT